MLEQKEVKIQVMNKLDFCLKKPVESQYSSSSRKKPVESQYSSSSRKNQEHRNIATLSLQLRSYN